MDNPSSKMNIIIEKWDSLVTPDMEINLDESILPEPLQHLLQQLRSSKPVRFFDQSKNPYNLQREVRAWSVPHPDYSAIWVDPASPSMVGSLGHEIGHHFLIHKGLATPFVTADEYSAMGIPSMIEDPLVERLLEKLGIDRETFKQDTYDDFKDAFTGFALPQATPFHTYNQILLCHRYVMARLILGKERFQPLGKLWATKVKCEETRRRTRLVFEYLREHLPETGDEYIAAFRFIASAFGVRCWPVSMPRSIP